MNYDEAFESAGIFGRAQYIVIAIYMVSSIYNGLQGTAPVFVASKVDFLCADTQPHNTTIFPDPEYFLSSIDDFPGLKFWESLLFHALSFL